MRSDAEGDGYDPLRDFAPARLVGALQPPAQFSALIRDALAKWPAIIKASGARVD